MIAIKTVTILNNLIKINKIQTILIMKMIKIQEKKN